MQDYQIDWEALLQQSPAEFIESLSSWLLPVEALAKPKDFYEADDTEATLTKSSDMTGSGVQSTGDALSSAEVSFLLMHLQVSQCKAILKSCPEVAMIGKV